MFVYNLKINGSKTFKYIFISIVLVILIIVAAAIIRIFIGASNASQNSPCSPMNGVSQISAKKMQKGNFDLEDFLVQLKQIKKLGPLENILKMLPGAKKMGLNNVQINPKDMLHIEAIILSMTPYERKHPEILKASRKQRIAKGSGRSVEEVNRLLKQFEQMKLLMKQFKNGNFKMPF